MCGAATVAAAAALSKALVVLMPVGPGGELSVGNGVAYGAGDAEEPLLVPPPPGPLATPPLEPKGEAPAGPFRWGGAAVFGVELGSMLLGCGGSRTRLNVSFTCCC